MSLNVRAGGEGGGGLGLAAGCLQTLPASEAGPRAGSAAGPGGAGVLGTPLQTLRWAGGGLAARTGPRRERGGGGGSPQAGARRGPSEDRGSPFGSGG